MLIYQKSTNDHIASYKLLYYVFNTFQEYFIYFKSKKYCVLTFVRIFCWLNLRWYLNHKLKTIFGSFS